MNKINYLWRQDVFIVNPKYRIVSIDADGFLRDGGDLPLGSLAFGKKEAKHAFERLLQGEHVNKATLTIINNTGGRLRAILEDKKVRIEKDDA